MPLPVPADDRTCLITGASSGIGAQLATTLAGRGHGVVLVARREAPLRALAAALSDRVRAEVIVADLADETARRAVGERIAELGLTVDVLVNNAGFTTVGRVGRSDRDREVSMIRTDVEAVVDLCSTFVPGMIERGRGAVLNVASTAGFQPVPGQAGYAAAKAFVLSYSRSLSAELRGTGVTATALCPGPVETEFVHASGSTGKHAPGALPKILWVSAADVARVAVAALDAGHDVVIPGAANKVMAYAGYLLPRPVLLRILARRHPAMTD
jgi:hypothetical protein